MHDKKVVGFDFKAVDEKAGTFSGIASVYGNVDLQCDVVMPGAFTKTLRENDGQVPLLWQHDMDQPIGIARLTDSASGLLVSGEVDLDTAEGRRAHSALLKRYVKGLSIGYDTVQAKNRSDGARELHELKLWELSIVTFPANTRAVVTDAKQTDGVAAALSALRRNVLAFKAGRVLSGTNLNHLRGAMGHLDQLDAAHKAAREHISAVIDAAAPIGDPDPDDPMEPAEKQLFRSLRALHAAVRQAAR